MLARNSAIGGQPVYREDRGGFTQLSLLDEVTGLGAKLPKSRSS
jgi:hypothetical protein